MNAPNLAEKFSNFPAFWSHFKERLADDYRPKGRINALFTSKNLFNYFKNQEFWCEEEEAVETFMSLLALVCAEVQQKDIIQDKVYSQIEDYYTVSTRSRRVVKTSESKGRKVISYEEPLLEIPDMSQGAFGFHNRSNWLKATQKSEQAPEVQVSEGITTTNEKGEKVIQPNWAESEDPAAVARLINAFPNAEIKFEVFIPRFKKSGIFMNVFAPATELVWDERTGERIWKGKSEVIREEEEAEGILPQTKVIEDDITEKEYNRLKALDPNSVAENWQVERLTRRKNYLEKEIKKTGGAFKDKLVIRLNDTEALLEGFKKVYVMPPVGSFSEKLSSTATPEEWDKATFWARINQTIGYTDFKKAFADFIDGYNELKEDEIDVPPQMFLMLGPPGTGKTHIAEAIAAATGLAIETISMNGKKDTSVFFGVPQEYAGAGSGEIVKGMARHKAATMIFVFDEIDKCAKDVQQVLGNITDRKLNKKFKDVFLDYPFPIGQLIVFCTANFAEMIDEFLKQRMTAVKISANTYDERIEIAKDLLSYEFKKYKVNSLRDKVSDSLIKRMLTWENGVRGLIDNVMKFSYKVYIDNKRGRLTDDWDSYKEWPITQRIELDAGSPERNRPACPVYTNLKAEHREGCECFKPKLIEGWVKNMGEDYPKI